MLFAIERVGAALFGKQKGLGSYKEVLRTLAHRSPLAHPGGGTDFDRLFELVRQGRNEALHEGAFARNLAGHAVDLALILEDALTNDSSRIADYMVRGPVVAHLWHPLQLVRQTMLSSSFSFLPVDTGIGSWRLVSDFALAGVLRQAADTKDRGLRLRASVECAVETFGLKLEEPRIVGPDTSISQVLDGHAGSTPILVVSAAGQLLGIATPFDLL